MMPGDANVKRAYSSVIASDRENRSVETTGSCCESFPSRDKLLCTNRHTVASRITLPPKFFSRLPFDSPPLVAINSADAAVTLPGASAHCGGGQIHFEVLGSQPFLPNPGFARESRIERPGLARSSELPWRNEI